MAKVIVIEEKQWDRWMQRLAQQAQEKSQAEKKEGK